MKASKHGADILLFAVQPPNYKFNSTFSQPQASTGHFGALKTPAPRASRRTPLSVQINERLNLKAQEYGGKMDPASGVHLRTGVCVCACMCA